MKDKEYFFYPDYKNRKKKFLRLCNETYYKVQKFEEKEHNKQINICQVEKQ